MEHFVTLESMPAGLVVPDDLAGRFGHDPDKHLLYYRGFMSKAEFDRLYQLHESWPYRRALEELFRLSTAAPGKTSLNLRRVASLLTHLVRP
jgi:hypothetical protein